MHIQGEKKVGRVTEGKPAGHRHRLAGEDLAVMGESFGSTAAFVQHFQGCHRHGRRVVRGVAEPAMPCVDKPPASGARFSPDFPP
jgi:hypothetical protein